MNFFGRIQKKNGKMVYVKSSDQTLYQQFIDSLPEGAIIEFYADAQLADGSLAQLAKIHAMIRELANKNGDTFEAMKLMVKNNAGLCKIGTNDQGEEELICKSFGDCSTEELSLAIQAAIEIGTMIGLY